MTKRKRIPKAIETEVLLRSRRRCCLCFGLDHDFSVKSGQIAHVDGDSSNSDLDNLAFLCLRHHDEYDSRTSQSKGLIVKEFKRHRERLYEAVAEKDRQSWPTGLGGELLDFPFSPPKRGIVANIGPLPPGSRLPFGRNALFTGREDSLKRLARALVHDEAPSALVTQAVAGMGGVGKTQLAVEFGYRYGRFFYGVHWLNAGSPAGLGAEVAACGAAMGLELWPEKQPEQVARTLGAWRRSGPRLVVCLDEGIAEEAVEGVALGERDVFVCLDSALTDESKVRLADMGNVCVI